MKTIYYKLALTVIITAVYSSSLLSQITTNELPVSFYESGIKEMRSPIVVDPPDMDKVYAEDAVNERDINALRRVAVAIPVNFSSGTDGQWEVLPDSGSLWRVSFIANDAIHLSLSFDKFWLPDGGKFFIYGQDNDFVIGAVTSQYLQGSQIEPDGFSTGITYGDVVNLEYYSPPTVITKPVISVSKIYYGYNKLAATYDTSGPILTLAPNPAEEWVDITINGIEEYNDDYLAEFIDYTPRVIKSLKLNGQYNRVYIGDLANGYYIVRVITETHIVSKKLIKAY